ncbi:S8 family serine peptidase [bacterium]|nr:S8 family serine peptidase [bacterium]
MKLIKYFYLILGFVLLGFSVLQAESPFKEDDILIQLKPDTNIEGFEKDLVLINLKNVKLLSRDLSIYLMTFDTRSVSSQDALFLVKKNKNVIEAQFNHFVTQRVIPNDTQFSSQWDYNNTGQSGGLADADVDGPEAWDLVQGGITTTGDSVVVAIIDGGFYLQHQDIKFWKNYAEIPNNGIDDDNNGYVDDYNGWNAYDSNGNIPNDSHGTHVAGTAAAKGNNNLGVTGVNWNAKVMAVAGSSGQESEVVEAYGYVLANRKRYNQTNGTAGAFVVSTNASFGVDFGQPANFPLWCAIYDSLGKAGIISCGATANLNINIDAEGDIPTACPSDYLISVTNTNHNDTKNNSAAYGLTTIDLGAPGTGILSTLPNNTYGNLTGTSMATPHVTGAIGLLASALQPSTMLHYKLFPDSIALKLKEFVLNGTDPINALDGTTVTGGRLNIHKSAQFAQSYLPFDPLDPAKPTNLTAFSDYQTPNSMLLNWNDPDTLLNGTPISNFVVKIFRDGAFVSEVNSGIETFTDTNLTDGNLYSYYLKTRLTSNDSLSFASETVSWNAGGSQFPSEPTNLTGTFTTTSATLSWNDPTTQIDGTFLDDISKIFVYRDGVLIDSVLAGVQTYTQNPPTGEFYTYSLRAVDNETPRHFSSFSNSYQAFIGSSVALQGSVLDEISFTPVSAKVQIYTTISGQQILKEVFTDANGNFSISQIPVSQTGVFVYDSAIVTPFSLNHRTTTFSGETLTGTTIQKNFYVSRIDFLIVDDEAGNSEQIYQDALAASGLTYKTWSVAQKGEIPLDSLVASLVQNVIWTSGYEQNTGLTSENLVTLEAFLNQGGNLFLSGAEISNSVTGTAFAQTYLGAAKDPTGITNSFLKGLSTHPVGALKTYNIATPSQSYKDALVVSSGTSVAKYGTAGTLGTAIASKTGNGWKTILTGFEAAGISTSGGNPNLTPLDTLLLKIALWFDTPTGVEELDLNVPVAYSLKQNFPNPFNPNTKISFVLPKEEKVILSVYNTLGQLVKTLFDGKGKFGKNSVVWNGTNELGKQVSSGVYFYRLESENFSETKKMVLLK